MRTIELDKVFYFLVESVPYLRVTLLYVVVSLIVGFAIGALLAKAKMSKSRIACALAKFYTTIVRCTPSVVLLFIVYFGLPTLMSDKVERWMNNLPIVVFVCITFSIFIGASSSEIIRAAFESVNKGQREAGLSVGLSETQTFFHIILPQMFRQSIPNIGNTIIFLFKEGALAYTIGLRDVLGQAYFLSAKEVNVYALDMYIALTLIYWPITMILEKLFKWLEIYFTPVRKKAKEEEETIKGGVRA